MRKFGKNERKQKLIYGSWWVLFGIGSFDATVRIWDCKSQSAKPIQVLDESGDSISSVDVRGHEIATGSVDGKVRVYDLRRGMVSVDEIGRKYFLSPPFGSLPHLPLFPPLGHAFNQPPTPQKTHT